MSNDTYFTSGMAIYPDTAAGLSVTPGASDAYGSWVELVSSTASDALMVGAVVQSADNGFVRVQIATGTGGSESVKATLNVKPLSGSGIAMMAVITPYLFIASGSRIAIRMASSLGSPIAHRINLIYIPTSNVINPVLSEVANPTGAVATDGSNSSTTFKTNLTESVDNYWKDAWCKITSGALINQVKQVTAYNGTTKFITVAGGYTGTPAASVTFELINQ